MYLVFMLGIWYKVKGFGHVTMLRVIDGSLQDLVKAVLLTLIRLCPVFSRSTNFCYEKITTT